MQTEFTCGICRALWPSSEMQWMLRVNNISFAYISQNGESIQFTTQHFINAETMIEISVLMNNIKRQYQTT